MRDEWDRREERGSRGGRLKVFVGLLTVMFVVTLAWMVGNRLSDEALGVLAGAVCGVGAAIPTSLLIVAVTLRKAQGDTVRRRDDPFWGSPMELENGVHPPRQHGYPPIIVVSPQAGQPWPGARDSYGYQLSSLRTPLEREFTVVGGASDSAATRPYGDGTYSAGA